MTRLTVPQARQLLARILEEPRTVELVRNLEPRLLGGLIRHIGLEDAGELVALATSEQLRGLLDEDLWASRRPGADESFDADRFARWLEVMLEAGEAAVAEKLTTLPEDLLTLGLHRNAIVVDLDGLALELADHPDLDLVEKALDSCLYVELDNYRVIARRHDGWDALVSALLALDAHDHAFLQALLERCCNASSDFVEENGGLYEVLTSDQMLESDAAADREDRRSREGFVAPSSAAAFLALARKTPLDELVASNTRDPLTHAFFRDLGPALAPIAAPSWVSELAGLVEAEEEPQRRRLTVGDGHAFERALAELRERDPEALGRRMEELAYLANVLVAGCTVEGRAIRPAEAAASALSVCRIGLDHLASADLAHVGADKLFRIGFHLLHQLSLEAARILVSLLTGRPQQEVRAAIAADKPWQARGRLDRLADEQTVAILAPLLSELPLGNYADAARDLDRLRARLETEVSHGS